MEYRYAEVIDSEEEEKEEDEDEEVAAPTRTPCRQMVRYTVALQLYAETYRFNVLVARVRPRMYF